MAQLHEKEKKFLPLTKFRLYWKIFSPCSKFGRKSTVGTTQSYNRPETENREVKILTIPGLFF